MDSQNSNGKLSKLEALRRKFEKVQAQITEQEAKQKAKTRKDDTRLKR